MMTVETPSAAATLDLTAAAAHTATRRAVAIGVFDGVHRGHRHLLHRLRRSAHGCHAAPAVLTFHPHPRTVVGTGPPPAMLCSLRRRIQLLEATGHVDESVVLPFNEEVAAIEPEDFVAEILARRLGARHVLVGANFRFGRRRAGDTETLAQLGARHGFTVEAVRLDSLAVDGEPARVSSTLIRQHVAAGDVGFAARALGRPHEVEGQPLNAHQGTSQEPLAIQPAPELCLPAPDSYQARVHARGNVGATGPVTVASDGTITAWAVPSSAASASVLTVCFLSARPQAVARR